MQKNTRQLAAVMFTDMVGYTALMQEDEQKAKRNRDRHRLILEKSIQDHHGQILQYYGDGTLSIFGSAIEAVECAVKIQQELQKEPKIPLRIGLHVGDIVYSDEGIYGDAVNIASRIETLSISGGILISGKVYDEIKNHPALPAKPMGEFELKNVKRPVRVFAIDKEGLSVPTADDLKPKTVTSVKSIAVLPFLNMSADPDNEYFSDGITEELLNALTKVDGLKITSRTSSFAFKGKSEDVRQIGTQLNVTSVLEGSVRKAGNRIRITAQLINTADGYHLWSEVYDRDLKDIFEVQDEISKKIANTLREKLTTSQSKESIVKSPTANLEAYNLYLKGRFFYNKWSPDDSIKAIDFYEKAIELQPDFALPYAGLSACYCLLGSTGSLPAKETFSKARETALKALELDNILVEAYDNLAWIELWYEWNWEGARDYFKKALAINPDSAQTHQGYAMYFIIHSEIDQAINEINIAVQLDPLSLSINNTLAFIYFCAGRYNDALVQCNKILELDRSFKSSLDLKGYIYAQMGELDKSIETFEQLSKLNQDSLKDVTGLGYAHAKAGNIAEAEKCLQKLKEREQIDKDISLYSDYAIIYTGLKDYDKAFYNLEKAIETKAALIFKSYPIFNDIQIDPRFKQLMNKIGLAE